MDYKHLKDLAINDNGFIFDPTTGYNYNTNTIGLSIIRMLQHNASKDEILQKLFEEYEVAMDHLAMDYDHFVMQMLALNLIENDEGQN